jgi:glyoxylase I family protein
MPAPFNIVGIDHVVLRAADPAALERFYLDVLGLSFEKRQGGLAQLRAGNALIDIVSADETGPAGGTSSTGGANLDHVCLRVEPFDAAEIARHLAGQNVACGAEILALWCRGRGSVRLLARSGRQWHRAQGSGHSAATPYVNWPSYLVSNCRTAGDVTLPAIASRNGRREHAGH